jgi:DNA invertase Pin-like site-specific DNA recombinase
VPGIPWYPVARRKEAGPSAGGAEHQQRNGAPIAGGLVGLLAAVARQERVRLSERAVAGLQRAKAQGRVGGRPRTEHDPRKMENLMALRRGRASIRRIANELGLSATTVARLVSDQATLAR